MTYSLAEHFPEILTPEWQKDREECWQLALEKGEWKSEYRKKDLDKIRHYFFTGEVLDGLAIQKYYGDMFYLFPIQTKTGYDFYYRTHELDEKQVESNVKGALINHAYLGYRDIEHENYWNYHLSDTFAPTRVLLSGENLVEIKVNAKEFGNSVRAAMGNATEQGLRVDWCIKRFDYFLSIFKNSNYDQDRSDSSSKIWSYIFEDIQNSRSAAVPEKQKKLCDMFYDQLESVECVFPTWVVEEWKVFKEKEL